MNTPVVIAALALTAYVSCIVPLAKLLRANRRRNTRPLPDPPSHVRIVDRRQP